MFVLSFRLFPSCFYFARQQKFCSFLFFYLLLLCVLLYSQCWSCCCCCCCYYLGWIVMCPYVCSINDTMWMETWYNSVPLSTTCVHWEHNWSADITNSYIVRLRFYSLWQSLVWSTQKLFGKHVTQGKQKHIWAKCTRTIKQMKPNTSSQMK